MCGGIILRDKRIIRDVDVIGGTFEIINTRSYTDDTYTVLEGPYSLLAPNLGSLFFEIFPRDPNNFFPLDFTDARYSVDINGGSFDTDTGDFVATDLDFGFDLILPGVRGDFILSDIAVDSAAGVVRGQFGDNPSVIDLFTLTQLSADPTRAGTPLGPIDRFYEARVASSFSASMEPLLPTQFRQDLSGELFSYIRVSPVVATVPVPASIALLGLGLGGLALMTRRRSAV